MFECIGIIIAVSLVFGVVVDDELFRLMNTVSNFLTVALLIWHQRHVRNRIEPELHDTAAVVRRQLGERRRAGGNDPGPYTGPDRRKVE